MKRLLKLLTSRLGIVGLGLLLQLLVLGATLIWFSTLTEWVVMVSNVISWLLVLYILSGKSNPAYKMAWIIPILAVPVLGIFAYLFFGGNRLSKRLRRKMGDMDRTLSRYLHQEPMDADELALTDPGAAAQARYLSRTAHCPVYRGTRTEYFSSGEAAFARMLAAAEEAKTSLWLEYFILAKGSLWDQLKTILLRKAAEGVDVRLIYDDFGCISRMDKAAFRELEAGGVRTACFNKFVPVLNSRLNNRDHRKLFLVDGVLGFTGGVNVADEYVNAVERFGYWKDSAVLLEGPAVYSMTLMFLSMWNQIRDTREAPPPPPAAGTGEGWVQPFTDSPLDDETVSRTVLLNLLSRARRRAWFMTPYLIIDDGMAEQLTAAAKSGIDVRIITPGVPDKAMVYEMTRANYAALLEGGVRIFEFTPGFLHSKTALADEDTALVGTVNMDFRSLYLHFENGVWLYRADAVAQVAEDFEQTFPLCREVTLENSKRVGVLRRLYRSILRLLSPLM